MSTSSPDEIGTVTFRVTPRRRSIEWIDARPVRPLPSGNGWIVSNCAWARAAWTRGDVGAQSEPDEVVDRCRYSVLMWWNESCAVRTELVAADPHLGASRQ